GKGKLIEEVDFESPQERGGHPGKKRFQISANTPETEPAKVGKCRACHNGRMQQLPLEITVV
ncbi:hypothetical protein BJV74DRAFT_851191, partial [Russula compacta]